MRLVSPLVLALCACGRVGFDELPVCDELAAPYANSAVVDGASIEAPFEVCTAVQLDQIGQRPADWDKHFKLVADIDVAELGHELSMIGTTAAPFSGTIDGGGHTIANLVIMRPGEDAVGMVRAVSGDVRFESLSLVGADVRGQAAVGMLVATSDDASLTIQDVSIAGHVEGTGQVGGLVGRARCIVEPCGTTIDTVVANIDVAGSAGSTGGVMGSIVRMTRADLIKKVSVAGSVRGGQTTGGVVGFGDGVTISGATSTASVSGRFNVGGITGSFGVNALLTGSFASGAIDCLGTGGGAVGYSDSRIETTGATGRVTCQMTVCGGLVGWSALDIEQSYATGDVSGLDQMGGLVGQANGPIRDSYATGSAIGVDRVGGLVGILATFATGVTRTYATGDVTGQDRVGALVGETNVTTTMTIVDSFATGTVTGTSATDDVSGLLGLIVDSAEVINAYEVMGNCTNTSGACTPRANVVIDLVAQPNYFFMQSSAPLDVWDFATVWGAQSLGYPTLRAAP